MEIKEWFDNARDRKIHIWVGPKAYMRMNDILERKFRKNQIEFNRKRFISKFKKQ